jgi:hypothetical protein
MVVEGPSITVRYESWTEWRRYVREAAALRAEALERVPTEFCADCWGAGRILAPAANGEGLVPRTCARCDGRGSVVARDPAR